MLILLAGSAAPLATAATASNGNLGEIGYKRPHTTLLAEVYIQLLKSTTLGGPATDKCCLQVNICACALPVFSGQLMPFLTNITVLARFYALQDLH